MITTNAQGNEKLMARTLVMGASGFLGSRVTRMLVERGEKVRVMLRPSSSTRAIEDLDVERHFGDLTDEAAVRAAMSGIETVYYCVVDARPWLRDPTPMIATNVDVLRGVLEIACSAQLRRFVFTSSVVTMAIDPDGVVDERQSSNWGRRAGGYVASRRRAEEMVLDYCRERGLPGVAMCVANTYGPGDYLPTPHGRFVMLAAFGKLPFYLRNVASEVVGIDDAAEALILAGEKGRIGERYIVSERWMTSREILQAAAAEGRVSPPKLGAPRAAFHIAGIAGEIMARLTGRDVQLTRETARLMHVLTRLDHSKAMNELGWSPRPTPESIADGARFFIEQREQRRAKAQ